MILYYWIATACGAALFLLSVLRGRSDGDASVEVASDRRDVLRSWFPILSLRFLTFFATFGGLTGVALTFTKTAGPLPTAICAGAVGYFSGLLAKRLIAAVGKDRISSALGPVDCIGRIGMMKVAASPGQPGLVSVSLGDRVLELVAAVEEGTLAANQKVLLYQINDGGHVWVELVDEEAQGRVDLEPQ